MLVTRFNSLTNGPSLKTLDLGLTFIDGAQLLRMLENMSGLESCSLRGDKRPVRGLREAVGRVRASKGWQLQHLRRLKLLNFMRSDTLALLLGIRCPNLEELQLSTAVNGYELMCLVRFLTCFFQLNNSGY